eukprot:CAMPEP_0196769758 /NCGR_PEP_ID=MMETSP1104-20130614/736_1 /TAXON_ID=33652 /ORGANISM="Cafeteria sp., Strain Caron Lab Isolate" /LENGTH=165 /DNA_ID=CAMNT_0042139861 /DNA_START=24 /DNA_END=518 /DNA_ORIENTATION=+
MSVSKRGTRYESVPTADLDGVGGRGSREMEEERTREKRRRRERIEWFSTKMHAILWVAASATTIYLTDLVNVIMYSQDVDRAYLNISIVCLGIFTALLLYLSVYLPYIARIHLEWSVYCPRVIPTATAVGVAGTIAMIMALWPVYGLLTPLILGILFVGFLMSFH